MNNNGNCETHLIVLWNRARVREADILADIRKRLDVIAVHEIEWTPGSAGENFRRFYGVKLPDIGFKVRECGEGPFLLAIVKDNAPEYGFAETSRGHERVNLNLFRLKTLYREWTGGGHKVHTSNTPAEADHDLALLLGVSTADYLASRGSFATQLRRDISGSDGWKSAEELFRVLNATVRYVALRGIGPDGCPETDGPHGDIDLFTDTPHELSQILGGERHVGPFLFEGAVTGNSFRGKQVVTIGRRQYLFDIWDASREYYDEEWSRQMLKRRELRDGCCRLQADDFYWEMLYHCLIHKERISPDYLPSIQAYESANDLPTKGMPADDKGLFARYDLLVRHLRANGFTMPRPKDPTVRFNANIIGEASVRERLSATLGLENLTPVQYTQAAHTGLLYFKGRSGDMDIFVKAGDDPQRCRREFGAANDAWRAAPTLVAKPVFYRALPEDSAICTEWLAGPSLADYLSSTNRTREKDESAARDVIEIARALGGIGIVHRDLRPDNLMFGSDGHLKLIDFQFAVRLDSYKEESRYRRHPESLRPLGTPEYSRGDLTWDDMYSAARILEKLGDGLCATTALAEANASTGKHVVRFPHKYIRRLKLKKYFVRFIPIPSVRRRIREELRTGVPART